MGKANYLDAMEMQIEEWGVRIEDLVREAEKADDGNKSKIFSQIKSLRSKQESVRKKYEKLRAVNEDRSRLIRAEVEDVLRNLKKPMETPVLK